MKKEIILSFLSIWCFAAAFGQVHMNVVGGTTMKSMNQTSIVLNGDWNNQGSFIDSTGTVIFNGSIQQVMANSSGNFSNVQVQNSGPGVLVDSSTEVLNDLTIISGDVDLNGHVITVSEGTLSEQDNQSVKGINGYLTTTRGLGIPVGDDVAGFGMTLTSLDDLGECTVERGHYGQLGNGNVSINRWYNLTSDQPGPFDIDMVLKYDESELDGQDETLLQLYVSTDAGVTWNVLASVADPIANQVSASGITSAAMYTLSAFDMSAVPCPADLNGDGVISTGDLLIVLSAFSCGPPSICVGDINNDGEVTTSDLLVLLASYGTSCP